MSIWNAIGNAITTATGEPFSVRRHSAIGGGCINSAHLVADGERRYFIKLNDAACAEMFAAERDGLLELQRTGTVRVPTPVTCGEAAGQAFIVLEHLPLTSGGPASDAVLGKQLARLHQSTSAQFGWYRDNTIGSTPQRNTTNADWTAFWRSERLGFQLELAATNGYTGALQRRGAHLLDTLPALLGDHAPIPSLLHGDLWSGNRAVVEGEIPVIFDPAVYYGDREADIAMTELFGRFPPRFYQAYQDVNPLDAGYPVRKTLYNLYHVLNHLNLFGSGYLGQAEDMMARLLSEVR